MDTKIIQWNLNGLIARYEFLPKLIQDQNPAVLCLQEMNFKNNYYKKIKNYKRFFKNRINCLSASGGIVKNYISYNEVPLNTNL